MKSKRKPYISILRLLVGLLAIVLTLVLGFGGEDMAKWIITLVLAAAYVVLGIVGLLDYRSDKCPAPYLLFCRLVV